MHQGLRKLSEPDAPPPAKPAAAKPGDKPASAAETKPAAEGNEPGGSNASNPPGSTPDPAAAAAAAGKKEKPNPWKMYEVEKAARAKAEQELQTIRTKAPKEADVQALTERATKAEKLANDLANEIRYHSYEKSPEFQNNFEKPYQDACRRALEDLKEVPILDPNTNESRAFTADDLAQFSFMSLAQAKEVADKVCPNFATEIMAARKEIRTLFDKRQSALNEWKDKGNERATQTAAQFKQQRAALAQEVQTHWQKANDELTAHPTRGEYFKPREGDEQWNSRLEAGYALADEAFKLNLLDRNLTPDQRAAAVKKYAAVRARAASWGPIRHQNDTLKARVAELEKELAAYKDSTPAAGGSQPAPAGGNGSGSATDRIHSGLRALAK
jgi:hypothetical protein